MGSSFVFAPQDCAHRLGGAFVTLQIGGGASAERSSQWVEDDAFIDVAIRHAAQRLRGSQGGVPVFGRLLNGTDCDTRWSWHVDPKALKWEQKATEVCDASPGYIEENTKHWMSSPGKWPLGISRGFNIFHLKSPTGDVVQVGFPSILVSRCRVLKLQGR